jgi:hypothetical protein
VLEWDGGAAAFDRGLRVWKLPDGTHRSFQELKAKYPGPCADLVCRLLESPKLFVRMTEWEMGGATPLREVVSDASKAVRNLRWPGPRVIVNKRGEGFALLPAVVREPPRWMSGVLDSGRGATPPGVPQEARRGAAPLLPWMKELLELVGNGQWTRVQVLPGNGAEEVHPLLEQGLRNVRTIQIDLATIDDSRACLQTIGDAGEAVLPPRAANSRRHVEVARAAAGPYGTLVIVVQGWGLHAQRYGREALRRIAVTLHGFHNVPRPKVVLVLVSLTSTSHQFHRSVPEGTLLPCTPVLLSPNDTRALEQWARANLGALPVGEIEEVLREAGGQLGSIRSAMRRVDDHQNERLRAIRAAHEQAAEGILAALGPCCKDVVIKNAGRPECVKILKDAGVLVQDDRELRPLIEEWARCWGRAKEAK